MAITIVGGTNGNGGNSPSTAVTPALPTGWQAGDIILAVGYVDFSVDTSVSQTSGSGTWTLKSLGGHATPNNGSAFLFYRVMGAGDTTPTFTVSPTNGNWAYATVALRPDPGNTISVDSFGADQFPAGTSSTTWTPSSASASGSGEASVFLLAGLANNATATTFSMTPPAGWTNVPSGTGGYGGNGSAFANFAGAATNIGVSGSVSPGALTMNTTFRVTGLWHALIQEVSSSLTPPAQDPSSALPGLPWQNRFLQERLTKHSVLFDYQLTFSGNYQTAGDLAFGANTIGQQVFMAPSPMQAQPGPAWQNAFSPSVGYLKRAILFDKATFFNSGLYNNPGGDITFGATAIGFAQSAGADRSQLSPGLAIRNQPNFLPSLNVRYPILWDKQLSFTGKSTPNLALGAITLGIANIPGVTPAQPAQPGPAWFNRFGYKSKRPVLFDGTSISAPFGPFCLGGSELDTNSLGGTQTDTNEYGGAATDANLYGGTQYSGCELQAVNITLGEFNDETIDLAITNNSSPFNLTGYGLQALFKTAAGVADDDPSTLVLSTVNGGITITNNVSGLATLVIPNADLQNTNFSFWRVDITIAGTQATAMYGSVTIRSL